MIQYIELFLSHKTKELKCRHYLIKYHKTRTYKNVFFHKEGFGATLGQDRYVIMWLSY